MHIDDVSIHAQQDRHVSRIRNAESQSLHQPPAGGQREMKDTAHTSSLARITSEALRLNREEDAIREDKVAQFRYLASDDVDFSSDVAIDAIFARMFA